MDPGRDPTAGLFSGLIVIGTVNIRCTKRSGPYLYYKRIVLFFLASKGVDMGHTLSLACTDGGLRHDKWREQGGCPATGKLLQVLETCHHCTVSSFASQRWFLSDVGQSSRGSLGPV